MKKKIPQEEVIVDGVGCTSVFETLGGAVGSVKNQTSNQSFSHIRGRRRRRRSDRGRLRYRIHVQDSDGPERQNQPRDQTVHHGSPGSALKLFLNPGADIPGTQRTPFLHFLSFKRTILHLPNDAGLRRLPVVTAPALSNTTRVCVRQPQASLISSRMTDGAITQKRRSWLHTSQT